MANGQDGANQPNRGDRVIVEISDRSKLLAAIVQGKLDNVSPSPFGRSCCIYRVHEKFRKINEYAYSPQMISIGPFHHGKEAFQAMETHKLRYAGALLTRINKVGKLEECMEAITRVEEEARQCYSEPVKLEKNQFVEMMVVDGLFVIELFRQSAGEERAHRYDPVFNNTWGMASLVRDMMLLENQLPMVVLERLYSLTMANLGGKPLNELAIRFFNPLLQREEEVLVNYFKTENYKNIRCKHLLNLLNEAFHDLPSGGDQSTTTVNLKWKHVPCVTELRQAGVKFRKGSNEGSLVDIRFIDGVLTIPPILIQDQTDSLFRNLIASEQYCHGGANYMTSYAFLMDSLIDSSNDVGFLRAEGIITNYLGDDKCVADLFNKLCSEVTLVSFYYSQLNDELNAFCGTRWHTWRATLIRDYFKTPWSVISILVAGLLIILTLVASVFAMLSFFVHKS